MVSAECNNDLQKLFGRNIKNKFKDLNIKSDEKLEKINQVYFDEAFPQNVIESFENNNSPNVSKEEVDVFKIKVEGKDLCLGIDNAFECSLKGDDPTKNCPKSDKIFNPKELKVTTCDEISEETPDFHYFKIQDDKILEKKIQIPESIEKPSCNKNNKNKNSNNKKSEETVFLGYSNSKPYIG